MKQFHLTTPQKNIWNLQKYYENTAITNLCGAIFYKERRDDELLRRAICCFIQNQSGIRLRFMEDGEPVQYVSDEIDEDIPVMEFSSMEELDCFAEKFAREPLEVWDAPMYRFVIICAEGRSGLLVVLSHLIADAWTFGLMANQIEAAYYGLKDTGTSTLLEADYRNYIDFEHAYLVSDRYKKDQEYWEKKYSACPGESRIRPQCISRFRVQAKRITKILPLHLESEMAPYCKSYSVTPAVLFETALIIYLAKINPESRSVTIGIPVLNRRNAKEKTIAGMCVSTMPLTVVLSEEMTVAELEKKIGREHKDIFRHQKYSYTDILKFLRQSQCFSGSMYDAMVSFQNAKTHTDAETKWYSNGYSEVPFVMHIDNRDGHESYTINVDYQTEVFKEEEEVGYVIKRLEYILQQMMQGNTRRIKDICIVPSEEKEKMICEFNDTHQYYPEKKCIHELFSEQVQRTPEKTALVFREKEFSYRKLEEMSNSLALFLRKKGVERNEIVPIIAQRGWQIIVAILGVLKAGGAYMPIDPDYPIDRVQYIVNETKSKIGLVLKYKGILDGIELLDLEKLNIEKPKDERNLSINHCSEASSLCYVIFTSGSTGRPKGVMIKHENVYNTLMWRKQERKEDAVVLSLSNIITDTFTEDLFSALLSGGKLDLVYENKSIRSIIKRILKYHGNVDIMGTPTFLKTIFVNLKQDIAIQKVTAVGEKIDEEGYQVISSKTHEIYNGYGPSECSICATRNKMKETDLSIGKPIANTQIYILGKNDTLLPIGVPGELCIAGDGVGLGYLNRPDLTAEKFVPNPFATEKNHHGKTMYRTGDLARWRADGEIEYLGRIDTQVKIRGLRIELEEIENVMSSIEGVKLSAVTDRQDEDGRQYLAGYYTSDDPIEERELRRCLSLKLPQYMIPNYFMHLDYMPMTASGKLDRKNLPTPDFTVETREYEAPVTEKEKQLCHLLEELLHRKPVGAEDHFFELGGDSLTAIEYVAKAHVLGINLNLQNVFDFPTVRSLCKTLGNGKKAGGSYEDREFECYHRVLENNIIDDTFLPFKRSLGNILLTGATGFLGVHVLERLLQEETGKIYCLIRGEDGYDRLSRTFAFYYGNKYELKERVVPVAGDVEQGGLADQLPQNIQTVIHTAASVKHYGPYDYFWNVNVEGTRNVVDYATSVGARMIHISTLSVSGKDLTDAMTSCLQGAEKCFSETSLYIGQALDNVYIRSKFEAEMVVYDAMLKGLDAKVIRVGNLTNRVSDYKFQPNYRENAFLKRIKALLELGIFPDYLSSMQLEFSPVDQVAQGIVKIAQCADRQCVFHLNHPRAIDFECFFESVRKSGIAVEAVEGEMFDVRLQETAQNSGTEYIFEAFQNDMDEQGRLAYESNIRVKNDFTVWFLRKTGFEWKEIGVEYIMGYLEYFRRIGYFKV